MMTGVVAYATRGEGVFGYKINHSLKVLGTKLSSIKVEGMCPIVPSLNDKYLHGKQVMCKMVMKLIV